MTDPGYLELIAKNILCHYLNVGCFYHSPVIKLFRYLDFKFIQEYRTQHC